MRSHSFGAVFLKTAVAVLLMGTAGLPLGAVCLESHCAALRLLGLPLLAAGGSAGAILLRMGLLRLKK